MSSTGNGEPGLVQATHQSPGLSQTTHQSDPEEGPAWQLRKYLLLLAILVATVTYVAGLDPPGGVWLETKDGHRTGNPILPATRRVQYTLFYYSNATAFAASLVVSILLLFMKREDDARVPAVRVVMGIDVCCLMVAYVAGSCRGRLTTIYAMAVCAVVVFLFVIVITMMTRSKETPVHGESNTSNGNSQVEEQCNDDNPKVKEQRKILMLLAIFVATITYTAALNPPGGFWEHSSQEVRNIGDPILLDRHWGRFVGFLLCNTASFAASLVIITLLLSKALWTHSGRLSVLRLAIAVALIGIVVAYAFGSSRKTTTTIYVLFLVCLVVASIAAASFIPWPALVTPQPETATLRQDRSRILLLATLAATVAYQAGLSPPGGVWRDSRNGHSGGDLILPATHARQYHVFFYCNSAAFATSIIVVMMVQSKVLVSRHGLKAAVILDLLGLTGAYVAGSSRDVRAPAYVLGAVVFVVMAVLGAVHCSSGNRTQSIDHQDETKMEKRRKLLLLLAILAVTITYQAGLSPPGKFWLEDGDEAHHVGDPVLADNYPRRYKVFFYSNTASFMVSIAVIVMLMGRNPSDANRNYWRRLVNASMFVSLIGLAGLLVAYAAGTTRRMKTSSYVFGLVAMVFLVALIQIHYVQVNLEMWLSCYTEREDIRPTSAAAANEETADGSRDEETAYRRMRKYLMLVAILAASVTYQAGLDPPGSVWPRDGDGNAAGEPALHHADRPRYHAFFYSNAACFMASMVVIVALLLQSMLQNSTPHQWMLATHTVVVLDLLGLLIAYAVGSSRDWHTSGYVLAMAATVLAYVAIYMLLSYANPNTVTRNQGGNNVPEIITESSTLGSNYEFTLFHSTLSLLCFVLNLGTYN
ncbi:hypothetical protein EJB05_45184, partial [Eragrostis curvula]